MGAVNSTATALVKLGRIDEARREYARALRRFSKEQQKSPAGFIRYGLAEVLFTAGRYREAAISLAQAARLFSECGLPLLRLKACLFEVENWARAGDLARARRRLEAFGSEVSRLGAIEPTFAKEFERALSGAQPDYERAAALRREATTRLEARLTQVSA